MFWLPPKFQFKKRARLKGQFIKPRTHETQRQEIHFTDVSDLNYNSLERAHLHRTTTVSAVSLRIRFLPGDMNGVISFCPVPCKDSAVFKVLLAFPFTFLFYSLTIFGSLYHPFHHLSARRASTSRFWLVSYYP